MKRTLAWLLGSLVGLCLLVSTGWASSTAAPGGYLSFVDTSGQLTLNDILSNRDKSRHNENRGLDGKQVRNDQRQDHAANRTPQR